MTKKKQVAIGLSAAIIIGIIYAILFLPKDFFVFDVTVGTKGDNQQIEIDWQTRLLEYAEFGLTFDDEASSFFYDEQIVRKLIDGATYFSNGAGTVEMSVLRDSDGKITKLNVQ
jgi:hypothetical protein